MEGESKFGEKFPQCIEKGRKERGFRVLSQALHSRGVSEGEKMGGETKNVVFGGLAALLCSWGKYGR